MMTDEQWKQVENALNSLGQAKLKIDGYDITLAAAILEPVHIKIASKIIARVRFPKYRTSSLS